MPPLELLPRDPLLAGDDVPLETMEDVGALLEACVLVAAADVPDDASGPDVPLEGAALDDVPVEDAVTALLLSWADEDTVTALLLVSSADEETVTALLLGGVDVEEVAAPLLEAPPDDDDEDDELLEELDDDVEAGPASSTGELPTKHAEHPAPRKRPPNTMLPSTRRMSNLRRS